MAFENSKSMIYLLATSFNDFLGLAGYLLSPEKEID